MNLFEKRPIEDLAMSYRLRDLRSKERLRADIYCHFTLEISR